MSEDREDEAEVDRGDAVEVPEQIELPITGEIDLHAFSPRDVVAVAEEYLRACRERGILVVRLVHGRGRGVQRAEVRRRLAALPFVIAYEDAAPGSGGWGATIARLRPLGPDEA